MPIQGNPLSSRARLTFQLAAQDAGGTASTVRARVKTALALWDMLHAAGKPVAALHGLSVAHVALYVRARQGAGIGAGTLENELSHIRALLKVIGRGTLAASREMSARAMGIEPPRRLHKVVAAGEGQYRQAVEVARKYEPAVAVMVGLARELGVRWSEAVRIGHLLPEWERCLAGGAPARIPSLLDASDFREALPANQARALAAVRSGLAITRRNESGQLLRGSARQSERRYSSIMSSYVTPATGVTTRALRYAYALDRLAAEKAAGLPTKLAAAHVGDSLGHRDGQGGWITRVALPASRLPARAGSMDEAHPPQEARLP